MMLAKLTGNQQSAISFYNCENSEDKFSWILGNLTTRIAACVAILDRKQTVTSASNYRPSVQIELLFVVWHTTCKFGIHIPFVQSQGNPIPINTSEVWQRFRPISGYMYSNMTSDKITDIIETQTDKKAVLPQRWPHNAPYRPTWVSWKFSGLPDYSHGYYSQHFSCAFVPINPMNVPTKLEVRSFTRSWNNRG